MKRRYLRFLLAALVVMAVTAVALLLLGPRRERPSAYRGLTNPIPPTASNLAAGRRLYSLNCAFCHGFDAQGDGVPANGLNPPPADLTLLVRDLTDDQFIDQISRGKLRTAMPAWENILSEQQRWQTILFLRHLTGQVEETDGAPGGPVPSSTNAK